MLLKQLKHPMKMARLGSLANINCHIFWYLLDFLPASKEQASVLAFLAHESYRTHLYLETLCLAAACWGLLKLLHHTFLGSFWPLCQQDQGAHWDFISYLLLTLEFFLISVTGICCRLRSFLTWRKKNQFSLSVFDRKLAVLFSTTVFQCSMNKVKM